jgi:H/ACA ribonucleoprotein complex subunit 1
MRLTLLRPPPAPPFHPSLQVPYFNGPIYLENKTQVGKVEEIFGPINASYFTIKMMDGVAAASYAKGDKFYIAPDKLLPMERFLQPEKCVCRCAWARDVCGRGCVAVAVLCVRWTAVLTRVFVLQECWAGRRTGRRAGRAGRPRRRAQLRRPRRRAGAAGARRLRRRPRRRPRPARPRRLRRLAARRRTQLRRPRPRLSARA